MPFHSAFHPNGKEHKKIAELFSQHYQILYQQAQSLTGDRQLAADAVQEGFVAVLVDKIVLEPSTALAYLSKANFHKCIQLLRSDKKYKSRLQEIALHFDLRECATTPDKYWTEHHRNLFAQLLSALPPQRQTAIQLVYYQHLPYKEAASLMRITHNTFKSHLRTGLQNLRSFFK